MNTPQQQPELFYESYLEALKDDVKAIGGSKEVGVKFWPQKDALAARNAVNDRLNSERRERFDEDQVRYIVRRARDVRGFSAALYFICDDTGFERPKAKAPEDERAALSRQVVEAAQILKRVSDQLERLTTAPIQLVSGGRG